MNGERFNVAIDGPAGAGKSTVARLVAQKLRFIYVDTGAMYRAITWEALKAKIAADDARKIAELAKSLEIRLHPTEHSQQVWVNGVDVTANLRSAAVNERVSQIAQIPAVRELLTAMQKQMASGQGVVMDGRDIGTHVLPDAKVKIFLTASVEERAMRRYKELVDSGQVVDFAQLKRELTARDQMDEGRAVSPLTKAPDAVYVDSTGMSIHEVVEYILKLCHAAKPTSK
ncbi:MAG TPA: (d)CMP kinase [Bacilli bacterium]